MKLSPLLAAAALACTLGAPAVAQTQDTPSHQPIDSDVTFLNTALASSQAEVDEARVAERRAQNPAIRTMARQMEQDHQLLNSQLIALAKNKNLNYSTKPTSDEQAQARQLQSMSGATYDHTYLQDQLQDHQQAIALFTAYRDGGQDADIKAIAAAALPTLQNHLRMVQQALGLPVSAPLPNPVTNTGS